MIIRTAMREGLGGPLKKVRRHHAVANNHSEDSTHPFRGHEPWLFKV
jgi:hypothetical protein